MHATDRHRHPPLSARKGWISGGWQVLHFKPLRYDHWSQAREAILGALISGEPAPLLKGRKGLTREQAIKLRSQKREQGWRT